MSILALLAVLAHLFTLGRSGPFSKLFCEPRCNPNKNEPLSQCFFNCGFLRYGKYYDGSVCWYFSRIGQAFATTGYCSQGMCLKFFTGGYNGSDAQRHCGDIPRDAPWLKNMTQSTQGPVFNHSESTQQTLTQSNKTSTLVLPTTRFRATTTAPPVTTATSLENSTLSYEGVTTTHFESTLQSTAYVPTEAPGSTESVTGEGTADGNLEAGSFKESTREYAQQPAATENSLDVLTTTRTEPESAAAPTGLATTAGGAYSEKAVTEYPESGLDADAHRPPVVAAQYSASDSTTEETETENHAGEFTVPFAQTTVAPTEGYIAGETTHRGRLNSTETTENAAEPPNHPTIPTPLNKHYPTNPMNETAPKQETAPTEPTSPTEPNSTEANGKQEVESTTEVTATVVPAKQTLPIHSENTLSAPIIITAEGSSSAAPVVTTELPALGTEIWVSSSLSSATTAPSTEKHTATGSVETTRENESGIPITTTASWYINESTTTQATPESLLEIPLSSATSAGTNAAHSATSATVAPLLASVVEHPQTTLTSGSKATSETAINNPEVYQISSPYPEVSSTTESGSSEIEASATVTSSTATVPSSPNETIESVTTLTPAKESTLSGSNYADTNGIHTTEKTMVTTEVPLEYLATTPTPNMTSSSQTLVANHRTNHNKGTHSDESITEVSLSSNATVPLIMFENSNGTLNAGTAAETPPRDMFPATESPHITKQDDGVENVTLVTVPTSISSPPATYEAGTFATATRESSYAPVGETVTENPTVLITTNLASESSHFTEQHYAESPTVVSTTAVTAPSSASTTEHQNEDVNSTTRHPTSATASEPASEEPTLKTTTLSFSGVPEMTDLYDVAQLSSVPTTFAAPVSSLPTSDENETAGTMTREPATTEEVTSSTSAGGSFNEAMPNVAPNYTADEYPENIAVTTTSILHTSSQTPSFTTEPITKIILPPSEPPSSATVPTVVAAEYQVAETQFTTTGTTADGIPYQVTTETPVLAPGTLTTKTKVPGKESSAYIVKQTDETSTLTEEMGTVTELRTQALNIARNDSIVTITKTRRSKPNKVTARVSWPSLVIAMAIIITRI